MDAHRSRLRRDGSFGHPGQMLKWMDLRASPILHSLFDRTNLSDCTEIDGWDGFSSLPD